MAVFNKGDLIYNEKFGEYAIYLGTSRWVGWISVYLMANCMIMYGNRYDINIENKIICLY